MDLQSNTITPSGRNEGQFRQKKIMALSDLANLRARAIGQRIVLCHGVFDILHAGHLAYFESAKRFGDILVVTVTADEHVHKGPGRPHFNGNIRANMIAALEVVDVVAISPFPTATSAIEFVKPHFYVKGPDYRDKSKDPTGAIYREEKAAEDNGGKLVFTEDETFSSSSLINEFFQKWTDEQEVTLAEIKKIGGFEYIEETLDKLRTENVQIIGEPIVDTYVFCYPEAISSKSPSISAKYLYEENYAGGSLAIANHLIDFVSDVTLITTHGDEDYFRQLLKDSLNPQINFEGIALPRVPTPRKTRFIAEENLQRVFGLTHLRSDQWFANDPQEFSALLSRKICNSTTTIIADFGHGLFEGQALEQLSKVNGFIGLNVQTNSSNFGYNPFTKHKNFSYLSIDLKEARVAYHDRYTPHIGLVRGIREDVGNRASVSMTLGKGGAYFFPVDSTEEIKSPAFAHGIVDPTGAGDAYFALTAMLTKVGCNNTVIPFLGNVFAALKTKIIGNKKPVTRAQLIKAVGSMLK